MTRQEKTSKVQKNTYGMLPILGKMWVYAFALKCIGAGEKAQQAGQTVVASRKNRVTGDQEAGGGFSFHVFLYLQRYRVTILN